MRIVCFGDSITRGISFANGRLRIVKENYPNILQQMLSSFGVEVLNRGVFNDNSDLLVNRLKTDVLDAKPDYVLIEIGGNDCNFRWNEVAERPEEDHEAIVPLDRYIDNLQHIIQGICAAGAKPVLLNLLPLDPVRYYKHIAEQFGSAIAHWIAKCGGIEYWHGQYNRSLQRVFESLDSLAVIDIRSVFQQTGSLQTLLSDDGIHPTSSGYRIVADLIARTFTPALA